MKSKEKTNWILRVLLALILGAGLTGCSSRSVLVQIDSTPTGAKIFFNDHYIGLTPLQSEIKQRRGDFNVYYFGAEKEGWLPSKKMYKEEFYQQTVADVVPEQIHFELHQIERYDVLFSSEPPGAIVSLDGKVIGKTPFMQTFLEHIGIPSTANFIVQLDGYLTKKAVATEASKKYDGCTVFVFPSEFHFKLDPAESSNPPPASAPESAPGPDPEPNPDSQDSI
jgi:hypothetical protein